MKWQTMDPDEVTPDGYSVTFPTLSLSLFSLPVSSLPPLQKEDELKIIHQLRSGSFFPSPPPSLSLYFLSLSLFHSIFSHYFFLSNPNNLKLMSYFVPRFRFPSFASFTNLFSSFFLLSSFLFLLNFFLSLSLIFLSVLKMMTLMKSCLERCFKKRTRVASDTFFFRSFSSLSLLFPLNFFSCFRHSIYFFIPKHFSQVLSLFLSFFIVKYFLLSPDHFSQS